MTLRKCITLKYLTKINHYPYSIQLNVILMEILMTFNISWVALKQICHNSNKCNKNHKKNVSLSNNLNLNNYSFEFSPTETFAGGTLLHIANHLSYKCRDDLNIYKKWTWIYVREIVNPKKIKYYCGSHLQTLIYGPYRL